MRSSINKLLCLNKNNNRFFKYNYFSIQINSNHKHNLIKSKPAISSLMISEIEQCHITACNNNEKLYKDPHTGVFHNIQRIQQINIIIFFIYIL